MEAAREPPRVPSPSPLFACDLIPPFTGPQTVDGLPDEFCRIPFGCVRRRPGEQLPVPEAGGGDIATTASLCTGWDADGLHMFIQVRQPTMVRPPQGLSFIWNGDAMEVFASVSSSLHGNYGPNADLGLHVIVAPPGAQPTQATSQWWEDAAVFPPSLDPSLYAARLVPGGYDEEIFLPWSVVAGTTVTPPSANAQIALDFACDIQAPDGSRAFQSTLSYQAPSGTTSCPTAPLAQPFCDDRTWCTWQLVAK